MQKALSHWCQFSLYTFGCLYVTSDISLAQVTSDGTVNTQVNQNGNVAEITGGGTRGSNLFHSFQDFSVQIGNEAFFNNADSISNIFSRVTGGKISNIDGLIRANGSASLFLINPAGIIFGEGARLDLGGSFYGSTASSILFDDGEFSAADLENPPLLTVNAPIGLGFRDNPGDIVNRSNFNLTTTVLNGEINPVFEGSEFTIFDAVGLEINPNENIALIGGNVFLEDAGSITAPGGNVELGGLLEAGELLISEDGGLIFPEGIERGDVNLTQQARVRVVSDGGGSININARNLELTEQSELYAGIAEDMGNPESQAGDININATESVRIIGSGGVGEDTSAFINGVILDTNNYDTGIRNLVGLRPDGLENLPDLGRNPKSESTAIGNGGAINIETSLLEVRGRSSIYNVAYGRGTTGNTSLLSNDIIIEEVSILNRVLSGTGSTGNINFETNNLTIIGSPNNQFDGDASYIITSNRNFSDIGNININANEQINFSGLNLIQTEVQEGNQGDAGKISIQASNFSDQDGFIQSRIFGVGSPGKIDIDVENEINFNGTEVNSDVNFNVPINVEDITINANKINLNESGIRSSTIGAGNAGNIAITADDSIAIGRTTVQAGTDEQATGNGGSIILNASNNISVDSSLILSQVRDESSGNAGEISISSNMIDIRNFSLVSANAQIDTFGRAGNLNLDGTNILIREGAILDASTENGVDAGSINLNGNNLEIVSGGVVVTSVNRGGNAGNVNLNFTGDITINGEDALPRSENIFELDEQLLIDLQESTGLFATNSLSSTDGGGNIQIFGQGSLDIGNNATVSVGSEEGGNGGTINIDISSLDLDKEGTISAITTSGVGGNIRLVVDDSITLNRDSLISAEAFGEASGGNIDINTEFIIAFPDGSNDILASAEQGQGGNITINAESLFGIQERIPSSLTNDINASSQVNGLDGTISISTPDINPIQGVTELPTNVVEPERTVAQACQANREATAKNSFTINGKGGIPAEPGLPLNSLNVSINGETNRTSAIPQPIETSIGKIQPARGIKVTDSGEVILTAYRTNNSGDRLTKIQLNCG
ncbi:filamentous hemagglutinin N-terminal domain-containing protein [Pleurocapsa sp. PCC 7319]|uniref:two-partner secretion domain-containing protein n=1 Tax=Pleurocapsa sp. PCC 7319 TaxID=118161 RepID=UPI000347790D|nr:filamentous hemagglutinin N-terminal domain-containing protein [Pleurocapsa sp. PCC 7319]